MNRNLNECRYLESFLAGKLNSVEHESFMSHLSICAECWTQAESARTLRMALEPFSELAMPDDADLRIRIALDHQLRTPLADREVMDIEETAAFLGITVPELVNCLDNVPAFEVAGRIRFNRERLIRWMELKERGLFREISHDRSLMKSNILTFPGGLSDEQHDEKANSGSF
ncbi:helix-turn-helix domain-containing protein [bacterium]|nr:helix-turn-helix domain-containing protein [candidate division CSSED10-310 bacterium]